jgi:hypothetical protein
MTERRKVIVHIATSADGYIARPDGDLESVVPVFIGDGIPLIARRHRNVPLELHSVERFEDGLVQLHYRVQGAPGAGGPRRGT